MKTRELVLLLGVIGILSMPSSAHAFGVVSSSSSDDSSNSNSSSSSFGASKKMSFHESKLSTSSSLSTNSSLSGQSSSSTSEEGAEVESKSAFGNNVSVSRQTGVGSAPTANTTSGSSFGNFRALTGPGSVSQKDMKFGQISLKSTSGETQASIS